MIYMNYPDTVKHTQSLLEIFESMQSVKERQNGKTSASFVQGKWVVFIFTVLNKKIMLYLNYLNTFKPKILVTDIQEKF